MNSQHNLCGLLNINKPTGMTSRDVVSRVQRICGIKRVGHAGTLDPNATGVLIVLLGSATRLTEYVQRYDKVYDAWFKFGVTSNTDDIWGECVDVHCDPVTECQVRDSLGQFVGKIQQRPPDISAVKIEGRRAYKLARSGQPVELQSRTVVVHECNLVDFCYPDCRFTIKCGSGTYIRSLARDLGVQLECPAVMSQLQRTGVGPFSVGDSITLEQLELDELASLVHPPVSAVDGIPKYELNLDEARELQYGRGIAIDSPAGVSQIALPSELPLELAAINHRGELAAILSLRDNGLFKPKINFLPNMQGI